MCVSPKSAVGIIQNNILNTAGKGLGAGRGGGRAWRREGWEREGVHREGVYPTHRYLPAAEPTRNTRVPPPRLPLSDGAMRSEINGSIDISERLKEKVYVVSVLAVRRGG